MPPHPLVSVAAGVIMLGAAAALNTPSSAADPAERLLPSLVGVEYTLKYDSGQPPRTPGWAERCPSCGRYHIQPGREYVDDERPMEAAGYLISPTRVVTGDFFLQSRFIDSIQVRFGDDVVGARPVGHAIDHYAMMLELDEPLSDAQPLSFATETEAPYRTAHWQLSDARWSLELKPLSLDATITSADGTERFVPVPARGLVIDRNAAPVGTAMNQRLPADDSWRGSPEQWEWIDRADLDEMHEAADGAAAAVLPRVELEFRRGRSSPSLDRYWDHSDDEESITERHALGVLVSEDTMLVLTSLDARVTARLERITVHLPNDERVGAEFIGSLLDYGAIVIRLEKPQSQTASLDRKPIQRLGQQLLNAGEIELHGRNRITRFGHTRIAGYDHGWRRYVYPNVAGDTENLFLFDTEGTLVALPVLRRKPATETSRFSRERPTLTAASQIAGVLDDLDNNVDPTNVPLSEEEELRLAWLGVEMQALDEELARMYDVSEITNDGMSGGLISYVYAGSPADDAGLQPGDLLLRIHTDRRPRPIDVTAEEDPFAMWGGFPWDHYDEMPEDYFEHMPPPWPSADNPVNQALTEIGFGRPVRLEVYRDDESQLLDLTVVQSPPHHRAASRHNDEAIGLALNDLTYEVRRYFQKDEGDPGLVISRIEMGSRASVAGLKPYEIVTHINDEPLHSVDDLERMLEKHTDLRLNVERMHRTRIVRMTRPAADRVDERAEETEQETPEETPEEAAEVIPGS